MPITRFVPMLALAATLAAPLTAGAQTASPAPAASGAPMTGHHRHHRQSLMHALQSLNLTDAQKQQVATFHSQEQQANQNADPDTKRANAAKMREQIMGILTPDQKAQLQAQMQHHAGSAPAPNAVPSPAR
jgi:Spy/CpxP family protein refolding chaperone